MVSWFRAADIDGSGFLSTAELEVALAKLAPALAQQGVPSDVDSLKAIARYMDFDGNGSVNYVEMLATVMPIEGSNRSGHLGPLGEDLVEAVAGAIYGNRSTLLCMLQGKYDRLGTGRVTVSQFVEVLSAVSKTALCRSTDGSLLPLEQIQALASELAGLDGNEVEYEAFLDSFQIIEGLDKWTQENQKAPLSDP
eukprot:TRINITY_DN4614_c0_g3_i1.p2 TRINITY_DN4614_c0_g3~~TRINITY_DN4614_c0_g3_i1.p2  ORF type:complete len:195 (+),score=52.36 TRINITY_DN4614_c0_g3_i1:305-889(+)